MTVEQEIQDTNNKKRNREREKREYFIRHSGQFTNRVELQKQYEKIFDDDIQFYNEKLNVLNKNKYKFKVKETENIMDHNLRNQKTFDKWQWKVIQDETKQYYH